MTRPEPPSLKRVFVDHMWDWLTPTLIFVVSYAPASIAIALFAQFYVGSEFVTGFCLGGAVASGCVIISDLNRGYREFKRQIRRDRPFQWTDRRAGSSYEYKRGDESRFQGVRPDTHLSRRNRSDRDEAARFRC